MPKGTQPRIIPKRFATLKGMADENVRVRSWCRTCGLALRVNPHLLLAFYGPDFSLIDLEAPCRRVECDGMVFFLAYGHGRFEPLKS
jgi:hypothetical protein